jgi:hypothetical protein
MSSTQSARLLVAIGLTAAALVGGWLTAVPAQAAENSSRSKQPAKPKAASQAKPATAGEVKSKTAGEVKSKTAGRASSKTRVQEAPRAAGPASVARQPVPIPQGCAELAGVQRQICVECNGVALHMRVVCHQRVFWTTCKGKRLFEDSYCQSLQDRQGVQGEGG